MSKISLLPPVDGPLTGAEPVVLVSGGRAKQGPIGGLVGQLAQHYVDAAEAAAVTAQAGVERYFATIAAGVAGSAVGQFFASAETGTTRIYERTALSPFYVDQGDAAAPSTLARSQRASGLLPVDFGGTGDAATPDDAAFVALNLAVAADDRGNLVKLENKTYAMSEAGGLTISQNNIAYVGAGMRQTVLRQTNEANGATGLGSAVTLANCENVLLQDLTIHGLDGYGALYAPSGFTRRNIVFNRVEFTSENFLADGSPIGSTNGVRWINDTGEAENIWFIDCLWDDCARMALEIQNHGAGTTPRIGNIYIIRPRFKNIGVGNEAWRELNVGPTSPAFGFGISLTGYIDNVMIDRPDFDQIRGVHIEMVGASRAKVRDMVVSAPGYLAMDAHNQGPLISATNTRPMHGCEVDGIRWRGDRAAFLSTLPVLTKSAIDVRGWSDGAIRNVQAKTTGVPTIIIGLNPGCARLRIENNDLETDTSSGCINIGGSSQTNTGILVQSNRLVNTHATAPRMVVGAFQTDFVLGPNLYQAPNAAAVPGYVSGLASFSSLTVPAATLAEVLAGIAPKALTADVMRSLQTSTAVAFGAIWTPDFSSALNYKMTLTGPITVNNPAGAKVGDSGTIEFTQDATGNRAVTFGSNWIGNRFGVNMSPGAVSVIHWRLRSDFKFIFHVEDGASRRPPTQVSTTAASPYAFSSALIEQQSWTALANDLTISADANTAAAGQEFMFRIKDNGTARTITFTGGTARGFRNIGTAAVAASGNWTVTTVPNKLTYVRCRYNASDSRWDILSIHQEA